MTEEGGGEEDGARTIGSSTRSTNSVKKKAEFCTFVPFLSHSFSRVGAMDETGKEHSQRN